MSSFVKLSAITVYPVKALRGVPLEEGEVHSRGFRHDRRWMLVDASGRFVSQREEPSLCRVEVGIEGGGYTLRVDGRVAWIPEVHEGDRVHVTLWEASIEGCVHVEGSRFFSRWLDRELRLVCFPDDTTRRTNLGDGEVAFADGYPYLLVGAASLDDLNARLQRPVSMERFRPNLVVEGGAAYEEDEWTRLRIGELTFRGVKRCERCVVTTVDPATARKGQEPLRTLATYRRQDGKVWFGMNLCPDAEGALQVGDAVVPLERRGEGVQP